MAGKRAEPPHASERHAHEPGGEPESERIGPVAIARHVKDDGRALILYSHERRSDDAPPPA